jgi:hypothetical protein
MDALLCKPVHQAWSPGYPTRLEVAATPRILRRYVPPAWLGRREVARALGVCLAAGVLETSTGCLVPLGCVAITPPARFSEEEAVQIIKHELEQRGVRLEASNVELPGVKMVNRSGESTPFVADLANEDASIAVEYISPADCAAWSGTESQDIYYMRGRLENEVAAQAPKTRFRSFYLPDSMSMVMQGAPARWEAQRKLKDQVKSFVDWLKAQGAM